jgi:hypothetical protein
LPILVGHRRDSAQSERGPIENLPSLTPLKEILTLAWSADDNVHMAGKDLQPGAVKLHPIATDYAGAGITSMAPEFPIREPTLDQIYVAVLTNPRGRIVWDCNTAAPHLGEVHSSTSGALECAHDELTRRRPEAAL